MDYLFLLCRGIGMRRPVRSGTWTFTAGRHFSPARPEASGGRSPWRSRTAAQSSS